MSLEFVSTAIILAVGMAMDATSVSMVDGLREVKLKKSKAFTIALAFGIFQFGMFILGYFLGHSVIKYIEKIIPWLSLIILCFLGGKMIFEGVKEWMNERKVQEVDYEKEKLNYHLAFGVLMVQAVATSIDALTVGFAVAENTLGEAFFTASMIGLITFSLSFIGVYIGKKFGLLLKDKAVFLGGIILVIVGLIIFFN